MFITLVISQNYLWFKFSILNFYPFFVVRTFEIPLSGMPSVLLTIVVMPLELPGE